MELKSSGSLRQETNVNNKINISLIFIVYQSYICDYANIKTFENLYNKDSLFACYLLNDTETLNFHVRNTIFNKYAKYNVYFTHLTNDKYAIIKTHDDEPQIGILVGGYENLTRHCGFVYIDIEGNIQFSKIPEYTFIDDKNIISQFYNIKSDKHFKDSVLNKIADAFYCSDMMFYQI